MEGTPGETYLGVWEGSRKAAKDAKRVGRKALGSLLVELGQLLARAVDPSNRQWKRMASCIPSGRTTLIVLVMPSDSDR